VELTTPHHKKTLLRNLKKEEAKARYGLKGHWMDDMFGSGTKQTAIISLNSVKQLIFVMAKCSVSFAVRTEFLHHLNKAGET
jgi:hypothetical protein